MGNEIVLLNKIEYLGPLLYHCGDPLYKIVWQAVYTTEIWNCIAYWCSRDASGK